MLPLIWAAITVTIFGCFSYSIGRSEPSHDTDLPGAFFVAAVVAIFWPVVLALIIICGPFYFPYKLGVRARENEKNKAAMWDKLKN